MTWDEAKICGSQSVESKSKKKTCDGVGLVMRTGAKAKLGVRYLKCQKCGATWQVTFKRPPTLELEDVSRTNARTP